MTEDAAAAGLDPRDLADRTNGAIAHRTVYRFLANDTQTVRTARALAAVLGFPVGRYVVNASPVKTVSEAADRSGAEVDR